MIIAHLSDPHLRPRGHLYKGLIDSNAMFLAAVKHLNNLVPAPDVLLITGDIADEGSVAEYEMAKEILSEIQMPALLIPGNHDDRNVFRSFFRANDHMAVSGPLHLVANQFGPVRIIGLDITVPGQHYGDVDEAAQTWLDKTLALEPDRPTLIMLHHPPFLSGIPYIDLYTCRNGDRLSQVVSGYPAVERIVCGHIHRAMQLRFGGTLLCTAPSTVTAIALRLAVDSEEASYVEPPALLLHHWKPDTGLITHWVAIGEFPGPMPFA
ncbi:3',5'-cyclic AMP phosphodiesterase CpdA [Pseudomonas sp. JAI115]|uniref:phosphodiesterase n=1 Tax=Pseudomonas sp. JAI115 TaxID=2723061 RepID=UPI001609FE14|nr:phosphodiesterase [Pseudomonas sp. JAI115]MBB6157640.1 3',5'-cyclic AMP phosphodiesterase CpdA [Pseudomonas sp. JAI115]